MPLRDNIAKLIARAQQETDPEVLERIATRLYDALMDTAEDLHKNASSPSRENDHKRKKGATGS